MSNALNVHKSTLFKRDNPKVSVITPIFEGLKSEAYHHLERDLSHQTFQDFEWLTVHGVSPNGKARNVGVKQALGKILVFIDETTHLAGPEVLSRLVQTFEVEPRVGIAGASCSLISPVSGIQKQYYATRSFDSEKVESYYESWQVQHACMAIPKELYIRLGGESNELITGTDNDLRLRVHAAGYRMLLVPKVHVFHEPPKTLGSILRKTYRKGKGGAFAFIVYNGLFEIAKFGTIRGRIPGLIYKIAATFSKLFRPFYLARPVALLCEFVYLAGFVAGWVQWFRQTPDYARLDLPTRKDFINIEENR